MRILVIDDSNINQNAAKTQLKNHKTTVVGSYNEGQKLVERKHEFDVVLVDLLMPASDQMLGSDGMQFANKEMPMGIFLALLAAKNGAKFVAVFTDSDHHSHPASACFDAFNLYNESEPVIFMVEGAKVLLSNTRKWVQTKKTKQSVVRTKNWGALLKYLTK